MANDDEDLEEDLDEDLDDEDLDEDLDDADPDDLADAPFDLAADHAERVEQLRRKLANAPSQHGPAAVTATDVAPPPPTDAPDLGQGAIQRSATPRDVVFIPDGTRETVAMVSRSGELAPLELPSPVTYRDCSAVSFDGKKLLVASRVRTRCFNIKSGKGTTVLDGPWQTDVAWLDGGLIAVQCEGGMRTLDRGDPDVGNHW